MQNSFDQNPFLLSFAWDDDDDKAENDNEIIDDMTMMIWLWWLWLKQCLLVTLNASYLEICLLVHVFIIMICWRWQWWFRCSWIYWWWWWYDEETLIVSRCWLVTLNASQPENYSSVHFPMGSPTTHCSVLHSLYFFVLIVQHYMFILVCFVFFFFFLHLIDISFLHIFLTDLYYFSGKYSFPHCSRLCSQCVLRIL